MARHRLLRRLDPATARRLGTVGLGVVGAAAALGGVLWLIQRQLEDGRLIKVTLVHEMDPATRQLMAQYQPSVARIAEKGVNHNVNFFRKRGEEGEMPSLLGALAPRASLTQTRYLY